MPKVSIILPSIGQPPFINAAINSVINQTFTDWELVVIIDEPFSINLEKNLFTLTEKDRRINIIKNNEKKGFRKSLNRGLSVAKGEYIARIDDDDIWLPEKLEKQLNFLETNSDYVLVGCATIVVDEKEKEIYRFQLPIEDKDIRAIILSRNPFVHSAVMFKRKTALEIGGYNDQLEENEDFDLWLRLGTKGKMHNLSEHLVKYRDPFLKPLINKIQRNRTKLFISIIKKYQHDYPGYYKALFKSYLRFFYTYFPKPKRLEKFLYQKRQQAQW